MGHIRLGTLPDTKKWRAVVQMIDGGADLLDIADGAARAAERDLARMPDDPLFQFVLQILVVAPLEARTPQYTDYLNELGVTEAETESVGSFLAALGRAIDRKASEIGRTSDAGEMAKAALLESLSVHLRDRLPTLFDPTAAEVRNALASFANGQNFAVLARDYFARLTYRSLDYFLSRELANHTGEGKRFASDASRTAFQHDLAKHTFEASKIVEAFAGGWYGKTVWQTQSLDAKAIDGFSRYALRKMRSELGRRRDGA